jgi:hypothetical protein
MAAVVLTVPRMAVSQSQSRACTYDRCALRIENSNPQFPARLVQGVEARPVGTIGLFSGSIPLLESGPDSVRIPYETFRSRQRASNILLALGAVTALAAPVVFATNHTHPGPAFALAGVGVGFAITGLAVGAGAMSPLELAIARYNDALPDRR